jgi:hypothetical protein
MCFRYPGIRSQGKSRIIRTSRVELVRTSIYAFL